MQRALAAAALLLLFPRPILAVETVRIAMGGQEAQVMISGKGLAFGKDVEESAFVSIEGNRAAVRVASGHLEINGKVWTDDSVRFRAGDTVPDNGFLGSEEIRAGGFRVRGDVVVRRVRAHLQTINILSLEDYLVGVLGGEMPPDFPAEALKAQAVAARTYALQKKLASLDEPFHLGSSVLHQVYRGLNAEDRKAKAAVDATRGEILTYDLEPIEAYFHASCGGRTESGSAALGRDLPYLRSVECPCGHLRESRWELDLSQNELKSALGVQQEVDLALGGRTSTGRVRSIRVGRETVLDGAAFRQRLGYAKLKSLWFTVDAGPEHSVKINGRGLGHGAGLCQWGARLYAQDGWTYREILMHFYSGVELQRLY